MNLPNGFSVAAKAERGMIPFFHFMEKVMNIIKRADLLDALERSGFEVAQLRKAPDPDNPLDLFRSLVQPGLQVGMGSGQYARILYIKDATGEKVLASFRQQGDRMEAARGDLWMPNLCDIYKKIPLSDKDDEGNKGKVVELVSRTLVDANVLKVKRVAREAIPA